MAFTHTVQMAWAGGGRSLAYDKAYSSGAQQSLDEVIPDSSADLLVAFELDITQVQSIYIASDRDMLLEVNDAVGTGGSIALKANVPYIWTADTYDTIFASVDITALYLTNSSGGDATLKVEALYDPTV